MHIIILNYSPEGQPQRLAALHLRLVAVCHERSSCQAACMQVYNTKGRNQLYSRMGLSNLPLGQCFAHESEAKGSGLFQEHCVGTNESDCCECMVIQVHNNFTNTYQWCPNIKHTMR